MRGVPRNGGRFQGGRRRGRWGRSTGRRAADDALQFGGGVELQAGDDAEAVAQGVGQHAGAVVAPTR